MTEHWCNQVTKKPRYNTSDFTIVPKTLNVIKYVILRHYIYIIEIQRDGLWDESIIKFTKASEGGLKAIKQDNPELIPQIAKNEIWYTLIALRLLKSEFAKDAKCFELIEKKARDALKSELKFGANIDETL